MKLRNWLSRFMLGRNGADDLNRFLSFFTIAMLLISLFTGGTAIGSLVWGLGLASLIFSAFRMFSRNLAKRRLENESWLRLAGRASGTFRGAKKRFSQRKEYRFFRCPSCKLWLRVPKGKGKVSITCRQCGERFTKTT